MTTPWIPTEPTDEDFAWWREQFVPPHVLWYWDDAPIPHRDLCEVISAKAHRTHPVTSDIAMMNAFILWAIPDQAESMVIDDGSWRDRLTDDELQQVRELQIRLKRGLCFPSPTDDSMLVLDQRLWAELPDKQRDAIIRNQLADWDEPATLPVPLDAPDHISEIANRFLHIEGANCMSITAYAVTADDAIWPQWMWQDEFREVLTRAGWQRCDEVVPQPRDVLTVVKDDNIIHAAYALAEDRLLNKNGQSMFNPVRVVDLATFHTEWPDGEMQIWRQGEA